MYKRLNSMPNKVHDYANHIITIMLIILTFWHRWNENVKELQQLSNSMSYTNIITLKRNVRVKCFK